MALLRTMGAWIINYVGFLVNCPTHLSLGAIIIKGLVNQLKLRGCPLQIFWYISYTSCQ